MDARRARIMEAQLVSRGFSQEQARSAVSQGPEAIAALTAGGPLPSRSIRAAPTAYGGKGQGKSSGKWAEAGRAFLQATIELNGN